MQGKPDQNSKSGSTTLGSQSGSIPSVLRSLSESPGSSGGLCLDHTTAQAISKKAALNPQPRFLRPPFLRPPAAQIFSAERIHVATEAIHTGLSSAGKGLQMAGKHLPGVLHVVSDVAEVVAEVFHDHSTNNPVENKVCGTVTGLAKVGTGLVAGIGVGAVAVYAAPAIGTASVAAGIGVTGTAVLQAGLGHALHTATSTITRPIGNVANKACHATFSLFRASPTPTRSALPPTSGGSHPAGGGPRPSGQPPVASSKSTPATSTSPVQIRFSNQHQAARSSLMQSACSRYTPTLQISPATISLFQRYGDPYRLRQVFSTGNGKRIDATFGQKFGAISGAFKTSFLGTASMRTSLFSSSSAASGTGYGFSLGLSSFSSLLGANNLVKTYNSYNAGSYVYSRGVALGQQGKPGSGWGGFGQIGGVGTQSAKIVDLINSETQASADEYYFCFAKESVPFSDDMFKQVQFELKRAYFKYKTLPFFSLDFNQKGGLYPAIHPAFESTLIGHIIAYLDYGMKCFLNGGYFEKEFLDKWHETENFDEAFLRQSQHLKDFKKYCKEQANGMEYMSLREMESRFGLKEKTASSPYKQPFETSFRIIAFQDEIQRDQNVLLPFPNFKIKYSIEMMPDYKIHVEAYKKEHGNFPPEYEKLLQCYELFAQEIKEKMPQLPFFKDYFKLLGVINALCYFYTTLDAMGKEPVLDLAFKPTVVSVPKAFPPIPVHYYRSFKMPVTFGTVFTKLAANQAQAQLVDKLFLDFFNKGVYKKLPEYLITQLKLVVTKLVEEKILPQIPPEQSKKLNELELDKIVDEVRGNLLFLIKGKSRGLDQTINTLLTETYLSTLTEAQKTALKQRPIPERIVALQTALQAHHLSVQEKWAKTPALATTEIFQELPKQMMDQEGNILESQDYLRKAFAAAEAEVKKAVQKVITTSLEKIPAYLKMYVPLLEESNASLEQQKQDNIKQQTEEARAKLEQEAKQQRAPKYVEKLGAQEKLAAIDKEIEQEKSATTSVATLAKRKTIVSRLAAIKLEIDAIFIQTDGAIAKKIALITQEQNKILSDKKIEMSFISCSFVLLETKRIILALREKTQEFIEQAQQKRALTEVDNVHQQMSATVAKLRAEVAHFTNTLASDGNIAQISCCETYTHSFIDFTGSSQLAANTGDHYRILGGCGMQVPELSCNKMPHPQAFVQALRPALSPKGVTKGAFQYQGKSFVVFKLSVCDKKLNLDYEAKKAPQVLKALQILDAVQEGDVAAAKASKDVYATAIDEQQGTLMHYAAATYDAEAFELVEYCSPKDNLGYQPIHTAAAAGNNLVVAKLLNKAASLSACKTNQGLTPLMLAIQHGHLNVVKTLKEQGAACVEILPNDMTPLYFAVAEGATDIALYMLKNWALSEGFINHNVKMTVLHLAIEHGAFDVALVLLANNARFNILRKSDGMTALHCAAQSGHVPLLEQMVAKGASLTLALESKKTPMHLAAEAGQMVVVEYLLRQGIQPTALTLEDETPLMLAIKAGQQAVACALAAVTPINGVNKEGKTASLLAVLYAMPAVADALIKRGENPNLNDQKGNNYLQELVIHGEYHRFTQLFEAKQCKGDLEIGLAAQHGHFTLVSFLLSRGVKYKGTVPLLDYALAVDEVAYLRKESAACSQAELDRLALAAVQHSAARCLSFFLTKTTVTPALLCAAIRNNDKQCLTLVLAQQGVDLNVVMDKTNNRPLHLAVTHGAHLAVKKLLEFGANVTVSNNKGLTPYHIAVLKKDADLLNRLFSWAQKQDCPRDLWTMTLAPGSEAVAKVLQKHKSRALEVSATARAASSSADLEVKMDWPAKEAIALPAAPQLTPAQREQLAQFEACLEDLEFTAALKLLKATPSLMAVFKSEDGGALMRAVLVNTHDLSAHQSKAQYLVELLMGGSANAVEQLLSYLSAQGFNPALYLGLKNPLLAILAAKTNEEACYRLGLFIKHFPKSIPVLAKDKIKDGVSITELALQQQKKGFFIQVVAHCRKLNEAGNTDQVFDALHEAVSARQYTVVEELLATYPVDGVNEDGKTPLMLAAALGHEPLMQLLLKKGASPHLTDRYSQSVLYHAMAAPTEAAALLLLPRLKYPNKADRLESTPLMLAAAKGWVRTMQLLCEKGGNLLSVDQIGQNALHRAASKGQEEAIRFLVAHGFAVDQIEAPLDENIKSRSAERTALHLAAGEGHESAVCCLLHLGASPLKQDARKMGLCEYAIESKKDEVLALVKALPCFHSPESDVSLLHAAIIADNDKALSELIIDEVDLTVLDENGRSLLHLAALYDAGNTAAILLAGDDLMVDLADKAGFTALHYAARRGHVRLAKLLLAKDASPDKCDLQGNTALSLAKKNGQLGAVAVLSPQGAALGVHGFWSVKPEVSVTAAQRPAANTKP
ncbi:MAG: ankyrin repeat domain-containing protein [Legionellales bacterium]